VGLLIEFQALEDSQLRVEGGLGAGQVGREVGVCHLEPGFIFPVASGGGAGVGLLVGFPSSLEGPPW
jgi:hypothetical protein